MSELLRILIDIWVFIWPLKIVRAWEQGVWYVCGRYWRTVGPGCHPILPFFMELRPVIVTPGAWGTPLQTITLRDGKALTYSAMATLFVEDAALAMNAVTEWPETSMEVVAGLLSEQLADVDPSRFDAARGKRDRLIEELRKEADDATRKFGVRVQSLRFTNFMLGVRAYRHLIDRSTFSEVTIGV